MSVLIWRYVHYTALILLLLLHLLCITTSTQNYVILTLLIQFSMLWNFISESRHSTHSPVWCFSQALVVVWTVHSRLHKHNGQQMSVTHKLHYTLCVITSLYVNILAYLLFSPRDSCQGSEKPLLKPNPVGFSGFFVGFLFEWALLDAVYIK